MVEYTQAMETSVYEITRLTQADVEQTILTTRAYMARHRHALLQALENMGFSEVKFTRYASKSPQRPEALGVRDGRECCICFAPIPQQPLDMEALSREQCRYCDENYAESDVYYACLLVDTAQSVLQLIGPVPVKVYGVWQLHDPEFCQYIPLSMRGDLDRYSPIYGGAVIFKMDQIILPHVLEHGTLPRFSVDNLFTDVEQGESGHYALMSGPTPTHFMLVQKEELRFLRPFFYGESRPVAELELMRCLDSQPDCGVTELMDRTGCIFYAECLEAVLFPKRLPAGRHYMWTLSLVATAIHRSQESEPGLYQEPYDTFSQLCGAITAIEETEVDGQPAYIWTLSPLPHNPEVEVQVYVGKPLALAGPGGELTVGDVVEVEGFLYSSPDVLVETAESWQDSGEVAVMQETQQLETHSRQAHRGHARYSLAHAVVASAFAGAGYADLMLRATHTRQDATFAMRHEQGYTALLFLDVQMEDTPSQLAYTQEQIESALERNKAALGTELHAHRCRVHLVRRGERYAATLSIEPECPGLPAVVDTEEPIVPAEDDSLTEAAACRLLCNAICYQLWGGFAAAAHEDLAYTSLVNSAKTRGKLEYIRYMAERKPLWESQQAWPGIELDTGTIEYVGVRRPCFMITCYGRRVGAAVVTLRAGKVADIVTLPQEANDTFEKDAECAAEPRVFHPLRGHLSAYAVQPGPLQRFSTAYLQDCMIRKTGFCGATGSLETHYISDGVERPLDKVGARWVKLLRHEPSFCDLAFTCAGRTYAVCAVEVERHPENGGEISAIAEQLGAARERVLRMAEAHRLIPCLFPVQRDHSPSPSKTWNLWHLGTLEPVTPVMETGETAAAVSEWEVLHAALSEAEHMLSVGGCELIACHDTPELLPHLWFRDPHGQLSWLIIRPHTSVVHADRAASDEELLAARLTPGVAGFVIDAEPYQDYALTKPATSRDSFHHVKITMPLPIQ